MNKTKSEDIIRCGLAQISPQPGDLEANISKHARYIELARKEKVDLLVFPELSLTGYRISREKFLDISIKRDSKLLLELAAMAGPMTVVLGFVEEAFAAQYYNSAAVLRDGKLVFVHRKLNLATYGNLDENKWFGAGRYLQTFEAKDWHCSLFICADCWNPPLVYLANLYGATLMCVMVNSAESSVSPKFCNQDGWKRALDFYSLVFGSYVLMVNRTGQEEDLKFWGTSRIIDPFGKTILEAGKDKEELLIETLDYQNVREARFQLPTVRDSNLSLIHHEISRCMEAVGRPKDFLS